MQATVGDKENHISYFQADLVMDNKYTMYHIQNEPEKPQQYSHHDADYDNKSIYPPSYGTIPTRVSTTQSVWKQRDTPVLSASLTSFPSGRSRIQRLITYLKEKHKATLREKNRTKRGSMNEEAVRANSDDMEQGDSFRKAASREATENVNCLEHDTRVPNALLIVAWKQKEKEARSKEDWLQSREAGVVYKSLYRTTTIEIVTDLAFCSK